MDNPNRQFSAESVAGGSTVEALRRIRRQRRWRLFFKVAGILFVMLIALAFYAQTTMALRQLWLPMAGRQLGTKVAAESGTLSYRGKLYLRNFVINGVDGQPAFTADDIWFDLVPLSILTGTPHIQRAEASNPNIRVFIDRDGRSNWDLPGLREDPKHKKKDKSDAVAVRIDKLTLEQLVFDLQQSDRLHINVTAPSIEINDFAPGSHGDFALSAEGLLERPAEKITQRGKLTADGYFKPSADGKQMEWDTKLNSSLTGTAPGIEEQKVNIRAASQGQYEAAGTLTHRLALEAVSATGAAGSINWDSVWDINKNTRNGKLIINNISREALNPLLATIAPLQMRRGLVNGSSVIQTDGDIIRFDGEMRAESVSFELADQEKPTDIMSLRSKQSGEFNIKTSMLNLRQAEATLTREDRQIVRAVLEKPLSFVLGNTAASSNDQAEAALRVKIDGLTTRNLQPWLMLARVEPASQPTAGTLNGEFSLGVSRLGAQFKMNGELRAAAMKHPALGPNPLDVRNRIDISFIDFDNLDVHAWEVELRNERGAMAQAALTGKMRVKQQAGEFNIDLTAPRALDAASTLNLIPKPGQGIGDGRLRLQQSIKLDMAQGKSGTTGKLLVEGLTVTTKTGSAPLGVSGDNRLSFDAKRGRIDIESMRLNLAHPGQPEPGLVEVTGTWEQPEGAKNGSGQIHFTAGKLNLEPWLRMAGAVSGPDVPAIPFEANEEITADAAGKFRIRGDMSFGIDPGVTTRTTSRQLTVQIKHNVIQAGTQVQEAQLELTSQAPGVQPDRVTINANGELGKEPRILCTANAETLDLNPYLAWLDRLNKKEPAAGGAASSGPAEKPKPFQAVVDANLTVGELTWEDNKLTKAKGNWRYENGAMTLDVSEGMLNDGSLKGRAEIDMTRIEPRYAWNLNLAKANASRVFGMFDPSMAQRIQGEVTLDSKCAAQGSGETFKRTFQGQNTFTVVNGELHGVFLLDILAKQTLIESFSNMKFFDFSGGIDFANKTGKLRDMKITGPEHRIDIEGQFDFDGKYDVTLLPAIATGVAQKISNNKWLPQLVKDVPGFMQFPFKVVVKGSPRGYTVLPIPRLPVNIGNVGEAVGGVVGGVGGAVGGVIEKVPGSGVVTRPIDELRKLNPLAKDQPTTATEEKKEGIIERIPGSRVIEKPVDKLIQLNPLRRDRNTTKTR